MPCLGLCLTLILRTLISYDSSLSLLIANKQTNKQTISKSFYSQGLARAQLVVGHKHKFSDSSLITNPFSKTSVVDFPLGPVGPGEFSCQIYSTAEVLPHVAIHKPKKNVIAYHSNTHTTIDPWAVTFRVTSGRGSLQLCFPCTLYGTF